MNKKRSSADNVNGAELVTANVSEEVATNTELVTDVRVEQQPSIENPTYLEEAVALYSEMGADRYTVSIVDTTVTSLVSIEVELSVAIDKAVTSCEENVSTHVAGIDSSSIVKKIIKYTYDSNTGHVLKYNKDNYIPTNKSYVYEERRGEDNE